MLPIQIVLVIFFILAILRVLARFRAAEISLRETLVWILFWLVATVVAVSPNLSAQVAKRVGVGRGADLVVYAALVVLFFAVFWLTVKIEKLNREITKVVRAEALKK